VGVRMMEKIIGSCLCGEVSFQSINNFEQFHICHCIQCQKTTGSAHAANLFTHSNNIEWLRGFELVKRFDVPGRAITTSFCSQCGCGVPYLSGRARLLVVPAGCLDGKPNIDPQDNIFCSEKASWYDKAVSAKECESFSE